MPKVIVCHSGYGCDTGCCGHVVYIDDERRGSFQFSHPTSAAPEDVRRYITEIVTEEAGAEHVADIDWDNCIVVDD